MSVEAVHLSCEDGVSLAGLYYDGVSGAECYLIGHGFTGSAAQDRVRAVSQQLVSGGASVLAIDFRGHGRSQGRSTVGVDEVRDIEAALRWLRRRRPDAAIVTLGFSMGASVVVRHAGLGGRPDAVIAVSGPGRWYERGTAPMRLVHRGLETGLGRLALRIVFRTRVGGGWHDLPVSPVEAARGIDVPLLVVHGDSDPYFGLEHARMLASSAPTAELWIEAGMGHAENATTPELIGRMAAWARLKTAAGAPADAGAGPSAAPVEAPTSDTGSATMTW